MHAAVMHYARDDEFSKVWEHRTQPLAETAILQRGPTRGRQHHHGRRVAFAGLLAVLKLTLVIRTRL